jgi:flavin-binding protein dodecin
MELLSAAQIRSASSASQTIIGCQRDRPRVPGLVHQLRDHRHPDNRSSIASAAVGAGPGVLDRTGPQDQRHRRPLGPSSRARRSLRQVRGLSYTCDARRPSPDSKDATNSGFEAPLLGGGAHAVLGRPWRQARGMERPLVDLGNRLEPGAGHTAVAVRSPTDSVDIHRDFVWRTVMSNHVYRLSEIVGSSETSVDDAIRRAIRKAAETVRNIDWFEVGQIRGHVEDGDVAHVQVVLKIGFRVED